VTFADMTSPTRSAIEETLNILNTGLPMPPHEIRVLDVTWSLVHVRQLLGASGWFNFILHLKCLKHTPVPVSLKQPYVLCYLSKDDIGEPILLRHQIMVDPNCAVGGKAVTYDWLDTEWRKAVKEQIDRLNAFDPDVTRHPWALHKLFRINHPGKQNVIEGVTMILQWQEVELVDLSSAVEMPIAEGNNILPIVNTVPSYHIPDSAERGFLPPYTPGDPEGDRRTMTQY